MAKTVESNEIKTLNLFKSEKRTHLFISLTIAITFLSLVKLIIIFFCQPV